MKRASKTIHWLGAGLASAPGLRRLIAQDHPVMIWERDLAKAIAATAGMSGRYEIREATDGVLAEEVRGGDVVVSMLPAAMHINIAKLCLDKCAHFVSSSYIDEEMRKLDSEARRYGLSFVNEVGLDPGVDHMLTHLLIEDYQSSPVFDKANEHEFRSFCGGFPAIANDFKYKFSWSPLGVLKALKSPARAILHGQHVNIAKPWDAVENCYVDLPQGGEKFQSYPNRDSLPFIGQYGLGSDWNLVHFVRGTLRLDGWSKAWEDIFNTLETTAPETEACDLKQLSDRLWADHAYEEGEKDRVVLSVDLKVAQNGTTVWHKSKSLDARATKHGSAMARLVSVPVSLAAEAAFNGLLPAGVQAAPSQTAMIRHWLETIAEYGDTVQHTDHSMMSKLEAAE